MSPCARARSAELGNRAVIEHDLNVYRVLLALGQAGRQAAEPRYPAGLDYGMLDHSRY